MKHNYGRVFTILNLVLCLLLEISKRKANLSYVLQKILLDYGPLH